MEASDSTMAQLLPKAIKLAQVYDQVCEMGEEIVVHARDCAVALCVQANEVVHATIKTTNEALQARKQRAHSILQRNACDVAAALRSIIHGGCTHLV
jgi:hypothetical protein